MKYGYFDDEHREYVITRPDTPTPWANYLGSPEYGAIISNNAGGYSFEKSGASGRILRYLFNAGDMPGRYIYLRDNESGDYWSASWQPVGKPLDSCSYECRHGTGYTVISAEYSGIRSSVSYYVPLGKQYEVWHVELKNLSGASRRLTATGYAEFTSNPNYEQDGVNLQYSQFITSTQFRSNRIRQLIHGNLLAAGDGAEHDVIERFFALKGLPVSSYCGDKAEFLGPYRSYANPLGVESGMLSGKMNYCGNSCGALSCAVVLESGESCKFSFLLGAKPDSEAEALIAAHEDGLEELKAHWHKSLSAFSVKTPSPEFDSMVNTWNAFNCFITFTWSRAASFIYCGLRNGYGYRDTVQDIQGIIHLDPDAAAGQIRFMLSAQVDNGGGLPLVKYSHNPGHEDTPDDESYRRETGHPAYRADDALWLFPTVWRYITETGNQAFLDEVIPFANNGEGSVYEHLSRAIDFTLDRLGPHGLPAGLYADWNDCLRLGENGESSFVAMQFYYALIIMRRLAELKEDSKYSSRLEKLQEEFGERIIDLCFEGDRFIRGFMEDGRKIGCSDDIEYNLWLNPQSWSVISGLADESQTAAVLGSVHERLNSSFGAVLMDPPFGKNKFDGALAACYNAGTKENGAIFSQTQGWLILAEALAGNSERAFEYYIENCPAAQNDIAEVRCLEPYCYGQFTEGPASPNFGRSHVHWLTGTASTMMVACVEGILGIRPDMQGLEISPCVPESWKEFQIEKLFRGRMLHITVRRTGEKRVWVNGFELLGGYIPESMLEPDNEITVEI